MCHCNVQFCLKRPLLQISEAASPKGHALEITSCTMKGRDSGYQKGGKSSQAGWVTVQLNRVTQHQCQKGEYQVQNPVEATKSIYFALFSILLIRLDISVEHLLSCMFEKTYL